MWSFPPGFGLAGLEMNRDVSTHSRGESLIRLSRGFIGMVGKDWSNGD